MTTSPLKVRRVMAGKIQEDAAKACGRTRASVSLWEASGRVPKFARVKLAKLYRCSVSDLFSLAPRK